MIDDAELVAGRSHRFGQIIAAVDAANADDPATFVFAGAEVPKELTHARMMCEQVLALDPEADELQLIAARAHHLRRWELPRADYPAGRAGYLRWRAEQKRRHARAVAELMAAAGYDEADVDRVSDIVRKQGLGADPDVQTHEDALCLVFLRTQLEPVAGRLGAPKAVEVLAKTMAKMSSRGLAAAQQLELDHHARALLQEAAATLEGS